MACGNLEARRPEFPKAVTSRRTAASMGCPSWSVAAQAVYSLVSSNRVVPVTGRTVVLRVGYIAASFTVDDMMGRLSHSYRGGRSRGVITGRLTMPRRAVPSPSFGQLPTPDGVCRDVVGDRADATCSARTVTSNHYVTFILYEGVWSRVRRPDREACRGDGQGTALYAKDGKIHGG
jgi:hypothetical protein